jgi:hypothetical protein
VQPTGDEALAGAGLALDEDGRQRAGEAALGGEHGFELGA